MIKKIEDYIPKLKEMFPDVNERDIKRCVNYGWLMFYFYNLNGCDTLAIDKDLWFYCGTLYENSLLYFDYYRKKLLRKIRMLHHRKNINWDNYYYTIVNKPKKNKASNYIIENQYIFKILDEAKLFYNQAKYFVKFKYPVDIGYKRFRVKMKINKAEVVYIREKPMTFKDILISNNKYSVI